jgi:hypothetical protein
MQRFCNYSLYLSIPMPHLSNRGHGANGNASDSSPEEWEFESLCPQYFLQLTFFVGIHQIENYEKLDEFC